MAAGHGYVIPPRCWAWAGHPVTLRAACWALALASGAYAFHRARAWHADPPDAPADLRRPDPGGSGHTQIDFGGQWVMGRMLVLGHGRELYHRQRQWDVARAGYPVDDESRVRREESILPKHERKVARTDDDVGHDADLLMSWFMGEDPAAWQKVGGAAAAPLAADPFGNPLAAIARCHAAADAVTPGVVEETRKPAVGGPLYPPVHAFIYAPLGLFDRPRDAYALFQAVALGFAYLTGLGISVLTRGRVWWSVASLAVLQYPGCRSGLELGQNPTLSACIVVWGWVLAARGRDVGGGALWGLFAFKPVWGLAFVLVPLLMRRWRFCAAMVGTGAALGALTLPVVGLQSWFDWLNVGREAAYYYNRSANWINLSRDLQGMPRRFLHDFSKPIGDDTPLANLCGWAVWGVVLAATILIYLTRGDRRHPTGLGAGFLFLGAFLTCYRFMYYDILLSLVAVAVLLAEPWRAFRTVVFNLSAVVHLPTPGRDLVPPAPAPDPFGPRQVGYLNSFPLTVLVCLYVLANMILGLLPEATFGVGSWATAAPGDAAAVTPRLRFEGTLAYPWDTALILLLWAWCGGKLLVRGDER